MIKCQELGKIEIGGDAAEVLAEFSFITNCLARMNCLDRRDITSAFTAGLFKKEFDESGKSWEECWDEMDELIDKVFADANPHD